MRTINFCITAVGSGMHYAEFLVANLYATARHPERISISMSVHGEPDIAAFKNSKLSDTVGNLITVPPYDKPGISTLSVNHCRAINALAAQSEADITIISDYDMAFASAGWDARIENILESHDLCGAAYARAWFSSNLIELAWLKNAPLAKYQNKPNLSFFAITRKCLDDVFARKLTDFDEFIAAGGVPFQIVNTKQMADTYRLPLGAVMWMDTGVDIPLTIEKNNLKYQTFLAVDFDKQEVFSNRSDFLAGAQDSDIFMLPEIFAEPDGTSPFLVHFKKATAKSREAADFGFEKFKQYVEAWLKKTSAPQA